jgi:tight adherence protein C
MVQAEQTGAGVARDLRVQADDVRNRRRERAMEAAMSLPVKRVVPLVVCFMPGVFAWALGPAFYQLIQFLDAFTRNRGLR